MSREPGKYMQICSNCGSKNYTDDPAKPVKVCWNCHKMRIASTAPVWNDSEEKKKDTENDPENEVCSASLEKAKTIYNRENLKAEEREDLGKEADGEFLFQNLLGNLHQVTKEGRSQPDTKNSLQANKGEHSSSITFAAVCYGEFCFTIKAEETTEPVMLGRSAFQREFLSQDGQVGNEHCEIFFRNGYWFVRDHNSRNGTEINDCLIGSGKESRLNSGDILKLGHKPDSMAFRLEMRS